MMKICSQKYLLSFLLFVLPSTMVAAEKKTDKDTLQVYKLEYLEREQGIDEYETIMLVSDRYIRIDHPGQDDGYIVYDDSKKVIYSVSHVDKSVLVINQHDFSEADAPVKREVEYLPLSDAPEISGQPVFNYRVYAKNDDEATCTEVQLAENLLPEVTKILKNYHQVVSGQQVKLTDNKVNDIQTPCYYIDQIYNAGGYYEKGLPIQEWHSNERSRILTSYNESSVSTDKFSIPEDYRRFSIDKNSKTFID
jgi:hypothetical protein